MRKVKKVGKKIFLFAVACLAVCEILALGYRLYYATPKSGEPVFTHAGDAGSLYLNSGYSVALDSGNAWDTDRGQQIVDADYDALYSQIYVASDGRFIAEPNAHSYTVQAILDHDSGIPPALISNINSDTMWIKDADGKVSRYTKVKSAVTGDRADDDFHLVEKDGDWDAGTNVLTKEYIESFADPDKVLVFVTCKGDGREIFFWMPDTSN